MNHKELLNNFHLYPKYWKNKILNRDKNIKLLEQKENFLKATINGGELSYFSQLTNNNIVAQYTVITAIYSFLLKKLIAEFDGYIVSSSKDQHHSLLLSLPVDLNTSFKEYLQKVKDEILASSYNFENFKNNMYDTRDGIDLTDFSNFSLNIGSECDLNCSGVLFDVKISKNMDTDINVIYLEGFIKKEIIDYLIRHFTYWMVNLKNYITVDLSAYPLLTEKEKHQLLVDFNATESVFSENKTIVDLFEEQVKKTPYNVAVIFQEKELTYSDLNKKANQFANYINSHYKVNKSDVIGVFLPKSDLGIISLLAILKLGAVYLPIDTNYPLERINYLIKDSGLKLLINDGTDTLIIDNCDLIAINSIELEDYSDNINTVVLSNDLAYVIYTSGSTGQPKGVMVEHRSTINMFLDQIRTFEITERDNVIWFASVSFDASISEILMALNSGATLCIPTEGEIKNKDQFVGFLKHTQSSVVTFPPSYLGLLSDDDISGLRCIITAGEPANPVKAFSVTALGIDYYNAYGPTEYTVCVSIYKVTKDDFNKSIISIGKPIANTKVYILDEQLQPLPIGVSGKIYVSGAGLARGYLNKTALTNEKFIANPFADGRQMYDTGDLGCWLPNGTIEFLGRKDEQVKLRGFRIEPGEIENTILQFSKDIKQVVVAVKEHNQEKVLAAYIVATTIIDKADLRGFLQNRLPDYMIPGFYVPLEKLPLTPNGKIDKKSLAELSGSDVIRKRYVPPRNKTEEIVTEIWQEVLNINNIGIHDDFFELGGYSLIVGQVINRINERLGKTVSFKTFFSNATVEKVTANLRDRNFLPIPKKPEAPSYVLTASQNRLWILSQLEGGSLAYNMPAAVNFKGDLDINKLEESFKLMINRYEILRTYFKTSEDGEVRQYVLPAHQAEFKILQENFSLVENKKAVVDNYLSERNKEIFDLEKGPLLRAYLLRIGKDEYVFFISLHHIIGDGWAIELLIAEIVKIYNALKHGHEINLPALKIQYKDYALWFNEELQQEKNKASETYWLNQFSGEIPVLDLPGFKTRPLVQTYNGDTVRHTFGKDLLDKLKRFSQQHDLTLFMTLMSGINVLLHRYTGQDDIVVGTPIAGREHPDLENQLGLFLNTLALRFQIEKHSTFLDLISTQKETLLEAYDHQNYPFDLLVNKLNLKRDTSRSVLFDVLVVLQNQAQLKNINTEELSNVLISDYDFNDKTAQVDITFRFVETDSLQLAIVYNTDIYEGYIIERMFSHFENLLTNLIENPLTAIEQIDYLTEIEKQQLLFDFNDTEVIYPQGKTIVDLFEEQVAKNPDNNAVSFQDKTLTYADLNEQSNQLASYLRENYSIEPDDFIGIKLERSERIIVAILGILKSGAAYIPIDVNYPQQRINYIEKDCNSKIVINESEFERFIRVQENYSKNNIQKINTPNDLAYIIYTSGTTGNPKGVMVENRNVINLISHQSSAFGITETENILQFSNISFDASVEQIFLALLNGASLSIPDNETILNAEKLEEFIEIKRVTHLHTVPSFLENISAKKFSFLKRVISGGEVCPLALANSWSKYCDFYNEYGPTETTVTSIELLYSKDGNFSIGHPIANTQVYILDNDLHPVAVGLTGKIFISGDGITRGYLNKPELTAEKFILNPYIVGSVMYDTGDLGRWMLNGTIEFLGRKDQQVKLRGYRIELGEIESVITQFSEGIKQVILELKETNSDKFLVSYIVSNQDINTLKLKEFLQLKLPNYMIPAFYVMLDSFPLTPNGKIDRAALPDISDNNIIKKEYITPRNDIEKELVLIWKDVLGLENIGIMDDFFELGGHSLLLGQVINRIQKILGASVSYKDFFANPTILGLSKVVEISNYVAIPNIHLSESYPLTPSQKRLWVLSQLEGGELAYNMPAAVTLKGIIDVHKFQEAFLMLIARHEILRTSFRTNHEGEISQVIVPTEQIKFKITEQDFLLTNNKEKSVAAYLEQENNKIFDLEKDPLIRASLIRLELSTYLFFLSLHHIISDGWSLEVIISEVITIYNALSLEKEIDLPRLKIQYKDYAAWLNDSLKQEKYKLSEQYWLHQFKGQLPVLDLPSFKTRPLIQTYNGNSITQQFSNDFLEKLKVFSVAQDVTLFMTLMSGINVLLHRYTGQDDIIIGTPIAGRDHPDLEKQLGLFLNTLAIRSQIKEQSTFFDLISNQKETLLEAYDHQNYPFDLLVNKLNLKRDTSRSALFDVLVVLQNQGQLRNINTEQLVNLEVSNYKVSRQSSQFDISFTFVETTGLELTIEYNTDIYEGYIIERMFSHFENLLIKLLENPLTAIEKIDFLTELDKQQLLFDFNNTDQIYPKDKTVINLFEEQVARTPDNIAVVFDKTKLTYRELNEQSNQLAAYLIENYAIESNDLVGVKLDRSERMIVAIFGILKSGGAYVPIDLNYPQERIEYIVEDANLKLCIDENELDKFKVNQNSYTKIPIQLNNLNHLAYCIYTSGSTGKPKGVLNHHAGLYNRLVWMKSYLNLDDKQTFLQKTPYTFDVSVWELILPFITGSALVVAKPEGHRDATYLQEVIDKEQVTIIHFVPSMLGVFLENANKGACNSLLHIVCSGEELPVVTAQNCKEKYLNAVLHNFYGPTEAAIDVTAVNLSEVDIIKHGVSIGKPIANTRIYIVNNALELQPFGVPGELLISGIQVAKGYVNLPELTKDRFIADPFRDGYNAYRTGDVAKWQFDGSLAYLGRIDNQVKIRGNRIELGEVESAIIAYGTIQQVVVMAKELKSDKFLVSYIVSNQDIDTLKLKEFLQLKLPNYMIPDFYITLDRFPLTANGKIDRTALPGISENNIIKKEYVAPRNKTEKKLVELWQKVLEVDSISVLDNFFELGGHSLKAMKLIGLINAEFEIKIAINDLFKNIVLEDQATLIENISVMYVVDEENNENNIETETFSI